MCLDICDINIKKENLPEVITVYKIVVKRWVFGIRELWSPVYLYNWKIGENISNRPEKMGNKPTEIEKLAEQIDSGFHVFLDPTDALDTLLASGCNMDTHVVVKMTAMKSDLVSLGKFQSYKSAVFTKLTFKEEDFNGALRTEAYGVVK